jgi:dienelactone hydrolase
MKTPSLFDRHLGPWLAEVPSVQDVLHLEEPGLRGVFFDTVPYRGRPARAFAWIGLPEGASPENPVPGMVLVHGGLGSAFARWVRWWTRRGYAAIAMDTCGAMPLHDTGIRGSADWPRHSSGGPPGWGGFDQSEWAPEDQWPFHAVAAVIKAGTLLASLPGVDSSRIGGTGVSWGGYLTCIAAGLDPRWRCAMPVYGCGFLDASPLMPSPETFPADIRTTWMDRWDPSVVLPRARCPMLWLNGTNDFAFSPPIWQRSAVCTAGPRTLCLKLRYPHGHMREAEEARELGSFADACLNGGVPLISVTPPVLEHGAMTVHYGEERPLRSATLLMTPDSGPWLSREWHTLSAVIERSARQISATVPLDAKAACFSLVSDDWLTVTSDLIFP